MIGINIVVQQVDKEAIQEKLQTANARVESAEIEIEKLKGDLETSRRFSHQIECKLTIAMEEVEHMRSEIGVRACCTEPL